MNKSHTKFLVLGAGPAGVQVGYYLEQFGADYLLLEKNELAGSFYQKFPRHGTLISINKVYTGTKDPEANMRFDWNSLLSEPEDKVLKDYTKEYFPPNHSLVSYINDYVKRHNIKVAYNTAIKKISRDQDGLFVVEATDGRIFTAEYLTVATGFSKPYVPNFKGVELCENYVDCSVDPQDYCDKSVLVVGKGNSAFETADNLVPTASRIHMISPNGLKLAWKTHFVGHLRAVNNNFLDTYQLKSQNGLINGEIREVTRTPEGKLKVELAYALSNQEVRSYEYDSIILCTGFQLDSTIFDESCQPGLCISDRFPDLRSNWESVNIDNLYFAGTITQSKDYKKGTSGFIHGFRYNCRTLAHMLLETDSGKAWPQAILPHNPEEVTNFLIDRVNNTSALWQQFGFMGDVIVPDPTTGKVTYYYELPVEYIHDTFGKELEDYFVVSLEFGKQLFEEADDIFSMERIRADDVENANRSAFLHPVFRRYSKGEMVSERHLNENLDSEWNWPDVHYGVLRDYLETSFQNQSLKPQLQGS